MNEKDQNKSFYDLVVKMRRFQKSYFATQDRNFLEKELKPLEAECDRRLENERVTFPPAVNFRKAVFNMRVWQRTYFQTFTEDSIKQARRWEKTVDKWILRTEELIKEKEQPTLKFEG